MLLRAASAIAMCVTDEELNASYIVPSVFDPRVATSVAEAVVASAHAHGLATVSAEAAEAADSAAVIASTDTPEEAS